MILPERCSVLPESSHPRHSGAASTRIGALRRPSAGSASGPESITTRLRSYDTSRPPLRLGATRGAIQLILNAWYGGAALMSAPGRSRHATLTEHAAFDPKRT